MTAPDRPEDNLTAEAYQPYVLDVTDRTTGETVRLYGERIRLFNQPQEPASEEAREI